MPVHMDPVTNQLVVVDMAFGTLQDMLDFVEGAVAEHKLTGSIECTMSAFLSDGRMLDGVKFDQPDM